MKPTKSPKTRKWNKIAERLEESKEVMKLKVELKEVREKYTKIQAEDKKHRGNLAKEIYKIEALLYDT